MFSINAMGTIDKKLIYRKRKGFDDVKKYTKTVNPDLPGQKIQKGYFKEAILAWGTEGYSQEDKQAWNLLARTKKVITSGFNRFTSYRINAEKEGLTWNKLTNCSIYDVTGAGFKVDVNVENDYSGKLYLGTSKYSMLKEYSGVFYVNKYTFIINGLPDETKVYFYIKNTSVGERARTGIYSHYHVGGWVPEIIDVGNPAVYGNNGVGENKTIVDRTNPSDGTGKITTVEIYPHSTMSGVYVGTFFEESPNYLTNRDSVAIGSVIAGAKRTFIIDLDVVLGDLIGFYSTSGSIRSTTPITGNYWKGGNQMSCVNELFAIDLHKISLHGIGETTG